MIMVYFLLLMEILYLLTLKRNETCKANIRCVFSSQNCKFKAGAVYCIYWVADFYFVLRITLYRLYSSISSGETTHTHTHCGKLTLLSVVDVFSQWFEYLCFLVLMVLNDHILELVFLIRAWTLPQREIHAAITRDIYLKAWNSTAILYTHDTKQSA